MKFDLFSLMPRRDGSKPEREVFMETAEEVRMAEQMGFDIAWFAEHHFSNYSMCPSPLMMCAYSAAETTRIRLGPAVLVTPLYSPVRMIEEIGMVDCLSNGRLVIGLGSGYQDYEFERFGVNLDDSKDMFVETMDILELALMNHEYEYHGKHFRIPHSPLSIRTVQQPMPEVYVAGLYSVPEVMERVARSGYVPFATAGFRPASTLKGIKDNYAEVYRKVGKDPASMPFAVQRYVYVTPAGKADALDAADHIRYTARVALSMRFKYQQLDGPILRELPFKDEPPLEQIVDNAIVGSVDECIEQAIAEIETLTPTHFSCFMHFGGMDAKRVLRSMDLFGSKVMPSIDKHFGGIEQVGNPVVDQRPMAVSA